VTGVRGGRRRSRPRAVVATAMLAVTALAAGGCHVGASPPSTHGATGSLTVVAAASLTEAFDDPGWRRATDHVGLAVTYSFAGSQQVVAQVDAGAPADVVATADETSMAPLVAAGLVDAPRIFAHNKLAIVVQRGNPKGVSSLGDLANDDRRVVLADPAVPAGRSAAEALRRAGVTVHPVSRELDVKAVLRRVASGDADAGIVYVTDAAAAGDEVTRVEIPDDANVVTRYPAAVVRATTNRRRAQAFVDDLVGGAGEATLASHGFGAP
jgi:molybdate transport system substrate-binding protein